MGSHAEEISPLVASASWGTLSEGLRDGDGAPDVAKAKALDAPPGGAPWGRRERLRGLASVALLAILSKIAGNALIYLYAAGEVKTGARHATAGLRRGDAPGPPPRADGPPEISRNRHSRGTLIVTCTFDSFTCQSSTPARKNSTNLPMPSMVWSSCDVEGRSRGAPGVGDAGGTREHVRVERLDDLLAELDDGHLLRSIAR